MKKNKKQNSLPKLPDSSLYKPGGELIAALAYSIWEQEGRPEGRNMEHWSQAEAQLRLRVPDVPRSELPPPGFA